jgi:hypothetical protein
MTKRRPYEGLRSQGRIAGSGIDYDRYDEEAREPRYASPRRMGCRLPDRTNEDMCGPVVSYNVNDVKTSIDREQIEEACRVLKAEGSTNLKL